MGLYNFTFDNINKVKLVMRAVQHPLRQKLIWYIDKHPGCSVTEIYVNFRLEQSVVSQHLGTLRAAGIFTTVKHGKHVLYHLRQEALELIDELSGKILIAAGIDPTKAIKKYATLPAQKVSNES